MKRYFSTLFFSVLATCCVLACDSQSIEATYSTDGTTAQKEPTAKQWNQGVIGWRQHQGRDGMGKSCCNKEDHQGGEGSWLQCCANPRPLAMPYH